MVNPEEGQGPPLFLDQTEARKNVFRPPPALSQGLDHPPPPPPALSPEGLDSPLYLTTKFCCPVRFASILTNKLSPGLRLEGLQVLPDFTL